MFEMKRLDFHDVRILTIAGALRVWLQSKEASGGFGLCSDYTIIVITLNAFGSCMISERMA
jgi:hypothetical protein